MDKNRMEVTTEVLEAYLKDKVDREKRLELDIEAKKINDENTKMAIESFRRKRYRLAELSETKNSSFSEAVKQDRTRLAAKYMDNGIATILDTQRKTKNLLEQAQSDIDQFIEDEKGLYIRKMSRTSPSFRSLPDDQKEGKAVSYLTQVLKYGTCTSEKERTMKQDYEKLLDELARCKGESIAVQMAKDTFLEDNADLIAEARREKRLRELKKSGILEELDLVEKQEKNEEDNEE